MKKQYHILNGSALENQFPKQIEGALIVTKECFVDGSVDGNTLEELFATRALYLSKAYGGTEKDYYHKVVSEFNKMQDISENSDIHFWFEDDLFCQVNFWFVLHFLKEQISFSTFYLIRPTTDLQFGFGGMNTNDLIKAYEKKTKIEIADLYQLSQLWKYYQENDLDKISNIANSLKTKYPFLIPALQAHKERIPQQNKLTRPQQSLMNIINELETKNFDLVFREFSKRESIYGFGDLQVKRLFDEL